jgi:hypothetical protein
MVAITRTTAPPHMLTEVRAVAKALAASRAMDLFGIRVA